MRTPRRTNPRNLGARLGRLSTKPATMKTPLRIVLVVGLALLEMGCSSNQHHSQASESSKSSGLSASSLSNICARASDQDASFLWAYQCKGGYVLASITAQQLGDGSTKVFVATTQQQGFAGAVLAFDGASGDLDWAAAMPSETYATPTLIHAEDRDLVVIGGRNRLLTALDASDGRVVWQNKDFEYNFYTPAATSDLDGDGTQDLVVTNGGLDTAGPDDPRPAGSIALLSGSSGAILQRVSTPDGQETYNSPVVTKPCNTCPETAFFGTGGESRPGHAYSLGVREFLEEGAGALKELATSEELGFIAPFALGDLNLDGTKDIVAVSWDGAVVATDGSNNELQWKTRLPGSAPTASDSSAPGRSFTSSVAPALVDVNQDGHLDVIAVGGVNQNSQPHEIVALDGITGSTIATLDSEGGSQMSPLAVLGSPPDSATSVAGSSLAGSSLAKQTNWVLTAQCRRPTRLYFPGATDDSAPQQGSLGACINQYLAWAPDQALKYDLDLTGPIVSTPTLIDLDANGSWDLVTVSDLGDETWGISAISLPWVSNPLWAHYIDVSQA